MILLTEEELEDLLDLLAAFEAINEALEHPEGIMAWEDFKAELDADTSSPKDR